MLLWTGRCDVWLLLQLKGQANGSRMGTDPMMLCLWACARDYTSAHGEEAVAAWVASALDQPDQLARIASHAGEGMEVVSLGNRCSPLPGG